MGVGFWPTTEQMAEHEKPKDGYKLKEVEPEPEYEQNRKPSKLCGCNKTGTMSTTSRPNPRNCKCKELRKEPPKILFWNAHGLISSEKKWKIDTLKEQLSENNTFLMNFTETCLKKEIQDDKIPGFTIFRSDRTSKKKKKVGEQQYI